MKTSLTGSAWDPPTADPAGCARLATALELSPVTAAILLGRGVNDPAGAREFLSGGLAGLHDPFAMQDMAEAAERLGRALDAGERIRVWGDYDVDGVTATALLVRALAALGGGVDYYLPHRLREGYGLNRKGIEQCAADGVDLLVTVDCGIGAREEVALARELGLDVIVTDHHQPEGELPEAPTLNPRRADCAYPFKDLAGVGVAFKLLCAMAARRGLPDGAEFRFLDLVMVGTIGDVAPLVGENRLLVRHGLARFDRSKKLGFKVLARAAGLDKGITAGQVAFVLAPRLNAAGRLDQAKHALHLLLTTDPEEAETLAAYLCEQNRARQEMGARTLEEAEALIKAEVDLARDRALVLASETWHPGVIGIVASRLVERYHRPAFLIALQEGIGKGSARGPETFDLWKALRACARLLERCGGHRVAAGFTVRPEQIPALRAALLEIADREIPTEAVCPRLPLDAEAEPADLSLEAVYELEGLAPFGAGNPAPLLASRDLRIIKAARMGAGGGHLRLLLEDQSKQAWGAVWFGRGEAAAALPPGSVVDVCYTPEVDTWGGAPTVRLRLRDVAAEDGRCLQPTADDVEHNP
jgi:single-stranded-DNA-specific exonuclease